MAELTSAQIDTVVRAVQVVTDFLAGNAPAGINSLEQALQAMQQMLLAAGIAPNMASALRQAMAEQARSTPVAELQAAELAQVLLDEVQAAPEQSQRSTEFVDSPLPSLPDTQVQLPPPSSFGSTYRPEITGLFGQEIKDEGGQNALPERTQLTGDLTGSGVLPAGVPPELALLNLDGMGPGLLGGVSSGTGTGAASQGTGGVAGGGLGIFPTFQNDTGIGSSLSSGTRSEVSQGGSEQPVPPVTGSTPAAQLSISAEPSVLEGDQGETVILVFTVQRSHGGGDGQVQWRLSGLDPALFGGTLPGGSLNFLDGQLSQQIRIEVPGDLLAQGDRTATVTLSSPSNGQTLEQASASTQILDNEALVSVRAEQASVLEGNDGDVQQLTFVVTRSNGRVESTIDWQASGLDAADVGGPLPFGTLTFAVGELSKTITVPLHGDRVVEPDEVLQISLSNPSANLVIETASASTTVLNDDSLVSIRANQTRVLEGDSGDTTQISFTVTRTNGLGEGTVQWSVSGVDASDLLEGIGGGTVHFAAGETSREIVLTVVGDRQVEADKTLTVSLNSGQGNLRLDAGSASTVIVNDDTGVSLTPVSLDVTEGGQGQETALTFLVSRSDLIGESLSIDWRFVRVGTRAADANDFVAGQNALNTSDGMPSGTVTFAPNETQKLVTVMVKGDNIAEMDETFGVVLMNPPAGVQIINGSASGVIRTDESTYSIEARTPSTVEGNGAGGVQEFLVTRTGNTSSAGQVGFSIAGYGELPADASDFATGQPLNGVIDFAAGESSKIIYVRLNGDSLIEGDESYSVTLQALDSNTQLDVGAAFATIESDDQAVSIRASTGSVREGNSTTQTLEFIVTRTGELSQPGTVEWHVQGSGNNPVDAADFGGVLPSGVVHFAAGESTAFIRFSPSPDNQYEPTEGLQVVISSTTPGMTVVQDRATGSITNDDSRISIDPSGLSVQEGNSDQPRELVFTVQRQGDFTQSVSVDWKIEFSAGAGFADISDFIAGTQFNGTLQFGRGVQSVVVRLPLSPDNQLEPNETFQVVLSNPSAGAEILVTEYTGTILNDDVVFDLLPQADSYEGSGGTREIRYVVERTGDLGGTDSISWSLTPGLVNGVDGSDFASGLLPAGTLTFLPGVARQEIVLQIATDSQLEPDETFTLSLGTPNPGATVGNGSIDGKLLNDDQVFSIQAGANSASEGGSGQTLELNFTVNRTGYLDGVSSVAWRVLGQGVHQVDGADFVGGVLPSGVLDFTSGVSSLPITLQIAGDYRFENDEGLRVELYDPATGATLGVASVDTTVLNDDTGLAITATSTGHAEGDTGSVVHTFTVTRSGIASGTTTVDWSLSGDVDADDFLGGVLPLGTVTFGPGETSKTIEIAVRGDRSVEDDEGFTVTLSNASGNADITVDSADGLIRTDDIGISIQAEQAAVVEGAEGSSQVLRFTVTRSGDLSSSVTVDWAATGLTVDDFAVGTLLAGQVTFAAGETSKVIELTLTGDDNLEGDETLTLSLSNPLDNPAHANTILLQEQASTLVRNDDTGLTLSADQASANESNATHEQTFTFTITRSGDLSVGSVDWLVRVGGTVADASLADFVSGQDTLSNNGGLPSGTVTFLEGQTSAQITVVVAGDGSIELDEQFSVELINPAANTEFLVDSASSVISNDDLGFSIAPLAADKAEGHSGTTSFTFTVTRAGDIGSVALVDWSLSGIADAADFAAIAGTLTFAAGESSKTLTIEVNGDLQVEQDESFTVNLSNARLDGGSLQQIVDASASGIIRNDDQGFSVNAAQSSVVEGNSGSKTLVYTIERTGDLSGSATVAYQVTGSNGVDAADTVGSLPAGTLSFAAGESSKTVTIEVRGDTKVEADESFTLTLSSPSAGTLIKASDSTVVTNDDTNFSVTAPAAQNEGAQGTVTEFTFTVTRSGVTTGTGSVQWRLSPESGLTGADFQGNQDALGSNSGLPSGTVSFAAGETSKTITIRVAGDNSVENNEQLQVSLSAPVGGTIEAGEGSASTQILNDDASFSIAANTLTQAEGNTGERDVVFTVTRSGSLVGTREMTWTLSGALNASDLAAGQLTTGTLSFADGEGTATVTIRVSGDSTVESDEAVTVTLSNPSANASIGTASATTTLTNDDASLSISALSAEKAEGSGGVDGYVDFTFTVTRTGYLGQTSNVEWRVDPTVANAVNSADFFSSQPGGVLRDVDGIPYGTVTFGLNETSKTITLRVASDSILENNETLRVVLENPSPGNEIATSSASSVVRNDDAELNITNGTASQSEGDGAHFNATYFTYTVTRTGNLSQTSTVDWAVQHLGTNSEDFTNGYNWITPSGTISFAAGQSSTTFQVRIYGDTGVNSIEGNEDFKVVLSSPSSGTSIGTNGSYQSTIVNDDTRVTIEWEQARQAEKVEGESTTYTINLTRSGDTSKVSTLNWNVSGEQVLLNNGWTWEASADGSDFGGTLPSGNVRFEAGQTSKTISFTVPGDNVVEPNEWFKVLFSNPVGIDELYAPQTGTQGIYPASVSQVNKSDSSVYLFGEIKRDEAEFYIQDIAGSRNRLEGDTTADGGTATDGYIEHTFAVYRTISTEGPAWVDWGVQTSVTGYTAMDANDFWGDIIPSGRLEFADGESVKNVTIRTKVDDVGEFDEAFRLYLTQASPGSSIQAPSGASGYINNYVVLQNDDTRFDVSSQRVTEGQDLVFTITRAGDQRGQDSVDWSIQLGGEETSNESNNVRNDWYKLDPTDLDMAWILDNNPGLAWDVDSRTLSGSFTYLDGQQTKTVTLRTINDTLTETWREEVKMVLSDPENLGGDIETPTLGYNQDGWVLNDEPAALLAVTAGAMEVFEGNTGTSSITFTITRTAEPGGSVDYASSVAWQIDGNNINFGGNGGVQVSTYGGNTTWSISPYSSTTFGVVRFAAGETSKQVTLTIPGDTVVEPDTNLTLTLLDPLAAYNNALINGTYRDEYGPTGIDPAHNSASTTLKNDDIRLAVGGWYDIDRSVIGYEGQPLNFTIVRNGRLDNDLTISYTLTNGSTNNADFFSMSGTITLEGGRNSYNVSLADLLKSDSSIEGTEGFTLTLTKPADTAGSTVLFGSDPWIGGASSMSVSGSLLDSTTSYTATPRTASQSEVDNGQTTYVLDVVRAGYSGIGSVKWRVEGVDGNPADAADFVGGVLPSGTLNFANGIMTGTISIGARGDGQVENNETFRVVFYEETLSSAGIVDRVVAGQNSGTLTIVNDDTGISIADASITETDANQVLTFTITRTGVISGTSSMNWSLLHDSTHPDDFSGATSGVVNFAANQITAQVSVTVVGDVTPEQVEQFRIVLSNLSSDISDPIRTSATGTIRNDDSSFSISAGEAAQEGQAQTFTITRSHDTVQSQTINWQILLNGSADAADLVGQAMSGSVTFAPGELTKTITVLSSQDAVAEGDETYSVQITLGAGTVGDVITQSTAEGTILNDDAALNIVANQSQLAEGHSGTTAFTFTVLRSGDTSGSASVSWRLTSTQAGVADFTSADELANNGGLPSGSLTFADGESSKTITVLVNGDTQVENNENFQIVLGNPVGAQIQTGTASSTIVNDDASISIAATDASKAEGNSGTTVFTFTITRSGSLEQAKTVDWNVVGSGLNPVDGNDFQFGVLPSGSLLLPAGQSTVTLTVNVRGDLLAEANEGFTVQLSNPSSGLVIGQGSADGLIIADDVVIDVSAPAAQAEGGNGEITWFDFVVTRSGDLSGSQTLNWSVAGIGANPASVDDFLQTSGSVSFSAGQDQLTIRVPVRGDYSGEGDEEFRLSLSSPDGLVFTNTSADATILNDDVSVQIEATDAQHVEGHDGVQTVYTFTVSRSGNLDLVTTLDWSLQGVANAEDFFGGVLPSGSLSFIAGETSKTISITVVGDRQVEPDESFQVVLSNASDGSDIKVGTASGTIVSDDVSWDLSVVSTPVEGDSGATGYQFLITRSGSALATSLAWSVAGSGLNPAMADDFIGGLLPAGELSFAQGQMSQIVTVWIAGDNVLEPDEGFTLSLQAPNDALHHSFVNQQVDATIRNDDDVISIAPLAADAGEGTVLTFTVTRTGSLDGISTVNWRINYGDTDVADFLQSSGTLTFADGQSEIVLSIPVRSDRDVELDESFSVELYQPGAGSSIDPAAASATGVIRNDDIDLTLAAVITEVIEGDAANPGRLHFTVTRSGDTSGETSVDWQVQAGTATAADFPGGVLPSGQLVFAAGETHKDIWIDVLGDGLDEANEQFTLQLSNASGNSDIVGNGQTGTIVNDDDSLSLSAVTREALEGDEGLTLFTFRIERSGSSVGTASVEWHAAGSGDHPLSDAEFQALSGVVEFADGETSKTFTVAVRADELGEEDESFEVWLENSSYGSTIVSGPVQSVVLNDDPVLWIHADTAVVDEGSDGLQTPITFTVTRGGDLSGTASVLWNVVPSGSNPANAEDFGGIFLSGAVAFGVGESSKTITVYVEADSIGERDEGFSVVLSDAEGATILTGEASAVIRNDDRGLSIEVIGDSVQREGDAGEVTEFVYRVERVGDSEGSVSVQWQLRGTGTYPATAGDFVGGVLPSGELVFADGETYKDIVIRVQGDDTLGPDQTFEVQLSEPQGIDLINESASGTIVNDDNQFSIRTVDTALNEGDSGTTTVFRFTVTRSGDIGSAASIDWSVIGSGSEPADAADFFGGILPSGVLQFAAGETSKTLEILVNGDDLGESDEQFSVVLGGDAGGISVNPLLSSARATIIGDDVALTVLALDSSRNEGNDGQTTMLTYRILRAGPDDQPLTINYSIAGAVDVDDFTIPLTGTITMAAGVSEMIFSLPVRGDSLREGDEAFTLTLSHPAIIGGSTSLPGMIRDDDLGLTIAGPDSITEGNSGEQTVTYQLTRNPSSSAETFFWSVQPGSGLAVDGDDFGGVLPSGSVTFAAGSTTASFSFNVSGDRAVEANEHLLIELRAPNGHYPLLTKDVTLVNDDVAGEGDDLLLGTSGADQLSGLGGNDQLYGGEGSDILNGGDGDDLLVGGGGADVLIGGAGADRFHYESPADGMDAILDFQAGIDHLTFDPSAFGGLSQLTSVSQAYTGDVMDTLAQLAAQGDASVYRVSFAAGQFRFGVGDEGQLDELEAMITGGDHTGAAFFLISNGDVTRLYYDADTASGTDGSGLVALAELANQPDAHSLPQDVLQPQVV